MFGAMLDPRFPRGSFASTASVAVTGIVGVVAVTAVLYLIVFFPDRTITLFELFARRVVPRFEQKGKEWLHAFAKGLSVLRSPVRFLAVVWWTLLHWLTNALAFWLAFKAVHVAAPFSAALFLQGLIAIGVAIPSSPGFFGVWEAVATYGLGLFGVAESLAITWAVAFHILSFIPITIIGGFYFVRLGLHLRDIGPAETNDQSGVAKAP